MQSGSSPALPGARLPPLKALHAFEAVARHGSFAQGAAAIGVTPSAVSHQMQQLEAFLGVPLFRREAGRTALTAAGHVYAKEVGHALRMIMDATGLVAARPAAGHLVVASSPSFATKWLQPRLAGFLGAHPDIRIRLFTFSSGETLGAQGYDVAIVYGRPPPGHAHDEPLLTERLRPLCSPALGAALQLRSPRDLERATLIHSINALTWSDYLHRVGSGDVRPVNEMWLNPSSIAIDAAVAGLGVVLESELLAAAEIRDGCLVAPFEDAAFGVEAAAYYLIHPAGTKNGAAARAFEGLASAPDGRRACSAGGGGYGAGLRLAR